MSPTGTCWRDMDWTDKTTMVTTTTDAELIRDFVRVRREPEWDRVFVVAVKWQDCHSPRSTWRCALARPARLNRSEYELKTAALANRKYFRVCEDCGQRVLRGWMHDARICMSCAESHRGVVY